MMNHKLLSICGKKLLVLCLLVPSMFIGEDSMASTEFTVDTNTVLVQDYIGHGTQYNQNLYASISSVDGITSGNVGYLESRVKALDSQHVRIFFDPEAWDDVNYPDYMDSFTDTVQLAQDSGSTVNITYWHGPYNNITQLMSDFADVLYDLIVTRGLDCVQYVTVQNEPNRTSISFSDYESLYDTLDSELSTLGIRDDVQLIGGDIVYNNQQDWFDYMENNMTDVLDGYSVHIYWDYDNRSYAETRLNDVRSIVNNMSASAQLPVFITEYGVRGEGTPKPGYINGTTNPVAETNIYAFQHAWFHMQALNKKFVASVKWDAYKAKYDNGTLYHGEIGSGNDGYPLKPVYNVTRIFTQTARPGWQVVKVNGSVSNKLVTALYDDTTGDMAVYALNDGSGLKDFTIGGLGVNKQFELVYWNKNGTGGTRHYDKVQANAAGEITLRNIPEESFAALTTLELDELDLLGYWNMNESSGTVAQDATLLGHDAQVNGAVWTSPGKFGNALDFDGVNDYVNVPYLINPQKTGFTAMAWVKLDASSGDHVIFQQDGTGGRAWITRKSDGTLQSYIGGGYTNSTGTLSVGQWHHVAVTYDNSTVRLFIDGYLDGSSSRTAEAATGDLLIGKHKSLGNYWNGFIDEVRVYNRHLTVNEIKDIVNSGYWTFDETSGSTASDSSGNENNGSVYGASWTSSGKMDGALDFDGSNDYVELPGIINPVDDKFTASAWVRLDTSSGDHVIFQQDGTGGRSWITRKSNGTLQSYIGGGYTNSTGTLSVGQWHHVAVTYDGTTVRLWLDGILDGSSNRSGESSTGNILVGKHKSLGKYWNGKIDNVRIFNYKLDSEEIKSLFEQGQ